MCKGAYLRVDLCMCKQVPSAARRGGQSLWSWPRWLWATWSSRNQTVSSTKAAGALSAEPFPDLTVFKTSKAGTTNELNGLT